MTLLLESTLTDAVRQRRVVLQRPGVTESALHVLIFFVMLNGTPETWFRTPAEALSEDAGAPFTLLLLLGLCGLASMRVFGQIDLVVKLLRGSLPLLVLLGLMFSSVLWSVDLALSVRAAIVLLATLAWALTVALRFEAPHFLRLMAYSLWLTVMLNLVWVFAVPAAAVQATGEWSGVHGQKNALGFIATIGAAILFVAPQYDRRRRVVHYTMLLGMLALLVFSESATQLVATLIPLASMAVYHGFRGRKTLRGAVITSLVTASVFTTLFVTANLAFVADLLDKDVTLTGRTDLWQDLLPLIWHRPLLGSGLDATFGGYFSPVHEVWIQNRWDPQHAHNALLQIVLDLGIVGGVVFLTTYFRAIPKAIAYLRAQPGRLGLWPITFLTTTLMVSISESGVTPEAPSMALFMLAIWFPLIDPAVADEGITDRGTPSSRSAPHPVG